MTYRLAPTIRSSRSASARFTLASVERCLARIDCREQVFNPFIFARIPLRSRGSGSPSARAGWQPQHLVAENRGRTVLGLSPAISRALARRYVSITAGRSHELRRQLLSEASVSVPFTPDGTAAALPQGESETVETGLQPAWSNCAGWPTPLGPPDLPDPIRMRLLGAHGFLQRTDQQFPLGKRRLCRFRGLPGGLARASARRYERHPAGSQCMARRSGP